MNNLFIQFYYKRKDERLPFYILGNGFSQTHEYCKSLGDIVWVKHKDEHYSFDIPFNNGTVYLSCIEASHLHIAFLMARKYPNIKFILGGPICCLPFKIIKPIPQNIVMTSKSVEEWFGFKNFSLDWKLELPDDISDEDIIYFTYSLDNNICYWHKCIFCLSSCRKSKPSRRKDPQFEFRNLSYHKGRKIVRLGTLCLINRHILQLPQLPSDFEYRIFLRAGEKELQSLNSVHNLNQMKNLGFSIGIEFPSEKMWSYMKKGYNKDTVLRALSTLKNNAVHLSTIVGWPNISENDIKSLKKFMDEIPKDLSDLSFNINQLFAYYNTRIYDLYEKGNEYTEGPFYFGYTPRLTKNQLELNIKARDVILDACEKYNWFVSDHTRFKR